MWDNRDNLASRDVIGHVTLGVGKKGPGKKGPGKNGLR